MATISHIVKISLEYIDVVSQSAKYMIYILGFILSCNINLSAQTTFDWLDTAPDGNWKQGTAGARWNPGGLFDQPSFGILRFNNNHQLSMSNNVGGTYNMHQVIFGTSNTSNRSITGSAVRLFDFGGADPKIENMSVGTHTLAFNLEGDGDGGDPLELNPVNGNLIFFGSVNNQGSPVFIYGDNAKTIQFNNTISGGGSFVIKQNSIAIFNATHSYGGNTEIDKGELWLLASGDVIPNNNIYVGNSGQISNVAKLFLASPFGGSTFSRNININDGNANTRFIGGLNTSGTNTFSGNVIRTGSQPLSVEVVSSGGTVDIAGIINGSGDITITGAGPVIFSGANTYTGATTVTSGTLLLGGAERISNNSNLILSGGTFSTGAATGFTETVGTLELSASSAIALGTGSHTLTFAASSGVTWAGATLTVTGWTGTAGASSTGGKIFVGSNTSGLASGQLAKINFMGYPNGAMMLSTGEVVPLATGPTSSVISNGTGSASICEGGIANIKVTITGGTSPYSVVFSDGSNNFMVDNYISGANIAVSPITNATYTIVSVTDNNLIMGSGNSGSATIVVSPSTVPASVGTYSSTLNHIDGATYSYSDVSCNLLSRIEDASGGNELGSTTVNVVLTSAYPLTQTSNAQTFGGRKVTVTPASGGTATLTLYYTQSDFTFYNGGNGTFDVPSSGSNSDPNIGNLRIAQVTVGGNLDNFQAITPSSVTWNENENRWEIVLNNVTLGSAGSDFYFYGPEVCNLTVENNSILITNISETSANVSWDAVNGASGYVVRWRTGVDAWSTSVSFVPSKNLTFLNGGITYEVQVRAICNNGYGLASNSVGFTTLAPLPECSVPMGLSATGITSNGALIVWNAVSNSNVSYTIRWRVASPLGSWNQATTAITSRNLNPWLLSGTTYDIQVRTNCSGAQTNQSAWSSITQFTTLAPLPECSVPMGLSATGITSNGAMIVWNAVSDSNVSYTIRWRVASPLGSWSQATTANTSRNLNPWLLSGTTYDIQVRTNCSNAQTNQSAWSPIVQFSTNSQQGSQHPLKDDFYLLKESIASSIMEPMMSNSLTAGSIINSSKINNSDNINIPSIHIYPNPTTDILNLSFESGQVGDAEIRMMDVSGRIAKEMKFTTVEGSNTIQVSLEDLSHGVYMIRVSADNTLLYTGRVIKIE